MSSSLLSVNQLETVEGLERILIWARRIKPQQAMSASTFTTLDTLTFAGPLRISDLAEREGISQPGMTGLINRLEGEGLAERAADPSDGRASLVSITDAGRAALGVHRSERAALIAARVDLLSPADQVALQAALPAINRLTDDSSIRPTPDRQSTSTVSE